MSPEGKGQFTPEPEKPAVKKEEAIQPTAETTEDLNNKLFKDAKTQKFIINTIRNANKGAVLESDEGDVAQEVKAAVWRIIEKGNFDQSKAKLTTYIYRAIHNKFIDLRRKQKNFHLVQLKEYNLADPETPIENWINTKYITGLISQLPAIDQQVVKLKSEGYTNKEVGEKLKIPANTAGTKYSRSIEKLKKMAAEDKKNNPV